MDGWEGGVWKRREQKENVYYGCDERRRQLLTYQHTVYVYRCVIRVRVCVCVPVQLCVCVICPCGNRLPHAVAVVATMLWQQRFDICEG